MRWTAALKAATEAYEDALVRGLCAEGAIEAGLGAADGVDRQALLAAVATADRRSGAAKPPSVPVKRVYEPAGRDDGWRVLVDRLWPRGMTRQEANIDQWAKDLAPSPELRRWYGHKPAKWDEFRRRYRSELEGRQDAVAQLRNRIQRGPVTLLFGARDPERNNAVALSEYLTESHPPESVSQTGE